MNGTDDQEMWDIVNECFPRVLKAAVSGDVLAMDEAGRFYLGALIVNFEEGIKWLTKAALAEYWRALYDLLRLRRRVRRSKKRRTRHALLQESGRIP